MVALKFCKDTINFWVNKFFGSTVWVGNTALSFKDENTALAKIVWRGWWPLVLGRIVAIAAIDSTWWIDVEFGGDCHDRPSPRLFALLLLSPSCASGCAFTCMEFSTICHLWWRLGSWSASKSDCFGWFVDSTFFTEPLVLGSWNLLQRKSLAFWARLLMMLYNFRII